MITAVQTEISTATKPSRKKRPRTTGEDGDDDTLQGEPAPKKRGRKAGSTNGSASKSKDKKGKPQSPDPSTWRESRVPRDEKITKGEAQKRYRLSKDDFAELPAPEKYQTGDGYDSLLYFERDVERKAWEKHGGPEGWEAYLYVLRERHQKKHPGKPFNEPEDHAAMLPTVMVMSLHPAKARPLSPAELALKHEFMNHFGSEWVWNAANKAVLQLRDVESGEFSIYVMPRRDELALLRKALPHSGGCVDRHPLPTYPLRPPLPLSSSKAVDALREVLSRAPKIVEGLPDSHNVPAGLHVLTPEGEDWYEWNDQIFTEVYNALMRIIRELGVPAWKSARWEVYDTYAERMGGMAVDRHGEWSDGAYHWLLGRLDQTNVLCHQRTSTAAGKEYNDSLPNLTLGT